MWFFGWRLVLVIGGAARASGLLLLVVEVVVKGVLCRVWFILLGGEDRSNTLRCARSDRAVVGGGGMGWRGGCGVYVELWYRGLFCGLLWCVVVGGL